MKIFQQKEYSDGTWKVIQHHLVTTPNAAEDVEKFGYSYISGGNIK